MARFVTITPNTAIDTVIDLQAFRPGEVVEANSVLRVPAGKGINVARALSSLGEGVLAMGFVGEESITRFQKLDTGSLRTEFTSVPGGVRKNISIWDQSQEQTTHIKTPGFTVDGQYINEFLSAFRSVVSPNDLVILSGSLPPGAAPSFYKQLIELGHRSDARMMLDTSGDALKTGVRACPEVIAPNLEEFQGLTGLSVAEYGKLPERMKEVAGDGIGIVAVTLGEEGALLYSSAEDECYRGTFQLQESEVIRNEVGCGDAFLAGYAISYMLGSSPEKGLRLAMACAVANLFTSAPGKLNQRAVNKLTERIAVHRI